MLCCNRPFTRSLRSTATRAVLRYPAAYRLLNAAWTGINPDHRSSSSPIAESVTRACWSRSRTVRDPTLGGKMDQHRSTHDHQDIIHASIYIRGTWLSLTRTRRWAITTPPALPHRNYHEDTPPEDYDLNYIYPVRQLESSGVRLEPFIHTFESCMGGIWLPEGQELYRYMPWNAPASYTGYLTELETRRQKAAWQTFAIFDKTRPEGLNMAGTVSYTKSTEADLSLELGAVYIFPDFQRTHVNTHMNWLLLKYAFEELRLRRVQWRAIVHNGPSVAAAKRLGYELEGIILWDVCLPQGKEGNKVSQSKSGIGRPDRGPGRNTSQWVITWESWTQGVREHLKALVDRPLPGDTA